MDYLRWSNLKGSKKKRRIKVKLQRLNLVRGWAGFNWGYCNHCGKWLNLFDICVIQKLYHKSNELKKGSYTKFHHKCALKLGIKYVEDVKIVKILDKWYS